MEETISTNLVPFSLQAVASRHQPAFPHDLFLLEFQHTAEMSPASEAPASHPPALPQLATSSFSKTSPFSSLECPCGTWIANGYPKGVTVQMCHGVWAVRLRKLAKL